MIKETDRSVAEREARASRLARLYELLPGRARRELSDISLSVYDIERRLSEVRLSSCGRSCVVIGGENYPLVSRFSSREIEDTLLKLTEGGVFAYRDTIASGYISAGQGIRVGVSGSARYEGGRMVGVDGVSSLVFRMPLGECDFAEEVYREWCGIGMPSLLVLGAAMGGKTTALAALAGLLGSTGKKRVSIVDERCEFNPASFENSFVNVLSGYHRVSGIEQALRTMSAEVIVTDEIVSADEVRAIKVAAHSGAVLLASAHATTLEGAMRRECLKPLFEDRVFGAAVLLSRSGQAFSYKLEELPL